MANYAALVDVLTIAGSRLSTGEPNASGTVWIFQPGTNTQVNAYSDAAATTIITQPITLTAGGTLNTSDFPSGVYVTRPVRLFVQDVDGNTVVDTVYIPATAGDVGVENDGFTDSTLDGVLTKLFTSTNGTDGTYLESAGATKRLIQDKFREISVSVKDFGAAGDNVATDTTAIQAAIARVKALGGGVVYFPPGTYKIDTALTLTSGTGVSLVGAGASASILSNTSATGNAITLTSCTGFRVESLGITNTNVDTNTGSALSLVSCTTAVVFAVNFQQHGTALSVIGTAPANIAVGGMSILQAAGIGATARGMVVNPTTAPANGTSVSVVSSVLDGAGSGYGIEFAGAASQCDVIACSFASSAVGAYFNSTLTGSGFRGYANHQPSGIPLSFGAAAAQPSDFYWDTPHFADNGDAFGSNDSFTPDLARANLFTVSATAGGITVTVNAPVKLPDTDDYTIMFRFYNNNAGVTTWTLDAIYHKSAAINGVAGNQTQIVFSWDNVRNIFVEVGRSVVA